MEILIGRQGTQKMPINDTTVSRKHCKVIANGNGSYIVENLSDFGTKVDGKEIIRTSATLDSRLQLGQQFSATLRELLGVAPAASNASDSRRSSGASYGSPAGTTASGVKAAPAPKTYSISHLKQIWEDRERTELEMAESQRNTNLIRTGGTIFTIGGGVVASVTLPAVGLACSLIGIGAVVYSFIGMKKSETAKQKKERLEAFDDAWVCPGCGRSLLAKNYRYLVKNYQSCPHCKCRYVEK